MPENGGQVRQVRVKDALKAIRDYMDAHTKKMELEIDGKMREIDEERGKIVSRMRNLNFRRGSKVTIAKFKKFMELEKELYELHSRILEPILTEICAETGEMLTDSMQLFERPFCGPSLKDIPCRTSTVGHTAIIGLYSILLSTAFAFFFALTTI